MRHSTEVGLMHGQESSTSDLDRMSSTQVLQPSKCLLVVTTAQLQVAYSARAACVIANSDPGFCSACHLEVSPWHMDQTASS